MNTATSSMPTAIKPPPVTIPPTIPAQLREIRKHANLSQRELAASIGTTASVICQLESEDYAGHSLAMLRRVATACGMRVQVRFVEGG